MKYIYLFAFIFFFSKPSVTIAQPGIEWKKCIGGSGGDCATSIRQTPDGGYIIAGRSGSSDGDASLNRGLNDIWLVKTDKDGNVEWENSVGGSQEDFGSSVGLTHDSGFIVGGYSKSDDYEITGNHLDPDSHTTFDYWIGRFDSTGNMDWSDLIGGDSTDQAFWVEETTDLGYVIGGSSNGRQDGDKTDPNWDSQNRYPDYWMVKLNASGSISWDERYGTDKTDQLYHGLRQTADGGYILGGNSAGSISGDRLDSTRGGYDYWIQKISANHVKQWNNRYGGANLDALWCVEQTADNGYILAGYSNSPPGFDKTSDSFGNYDIWLVKIDYQGNQEWDKSYGGSRDDLAYMVRQTLDGGYIIAGRTNSDDQMVEGLHPGWCINQSDTDTCADYWVIKTDPAGEIEWTKTLGGSGSDIPNDIIQTSDGGYIIAGLSTSDDYDVVGNNGAADFWIVKFWGPPQCNFSAADTGLCENTCVSFTNLSLRDTSRMWYFPGANPSWSTDDNPQGICYGAAGTYAVSLVSWGPGGKDSITINNSITVTGYVPVNVSISTTTQSPICPGTSVTFTSQAANTGTTPVYEWYIGDSLVYTGTPFTTIELRDGEEVRCVLTSSLECTLNNPDTSNTLSLDVMNGIPLPHVLSLDDNFYHAVYGRNDSVCENSIHYNLGFAGGEPGFHYSWTMYNPAGSVVPPYFLQSGDTLVNYRLSPDSSHLSWRPDTAASGGYYTIQLSIDDGALCQVDLTDSVYVKALSSIPEEARIWKHVLPGLTTLVCLHNTAAHYQWGFDDAVSWKPQAFEGEIFQDLLVPDYDPVNRNYWVQVYDETCFYKVYHNGPNSSREIRENYSFQNVIFPNPTTGLIHIDVASSCSGIFKIEVLNSLSQVCASTVFSTSEIHTETVLDISGFADGLYVVFLHDSCRSYPQLKLVKQASGR